MVKLVRLVAICSLLLLVCLASDLITEEEAFPKSQNLIDLSAADFDNMVVDEKTRKTYDGPWFIKFYAPWCGACKRAAPIWNELADKRGKELKIARMDCTQDAN